MKVGSPSAAFLIAYPEAGVGPVSGSSGRNGGAGIPALGIGVEAADAFHALPDGTLSTARMVIDVDDHPARTRILVADLPGRGPDWVVVSAHIDGHPHGESAMDNATGVAVALGLARLLAPHVSECQRGLRLCLFSAEEWGAHRISYMARTNGRSHAAVDGHQHQFLTLSAAHMG